MCWLLDRSCRYGEVKSVYVRLFSFYHLIRPRRRDRHCKSTIWLTTGIQVHYLRPTVFVCVDATHTRSLIGKCVEFIEYDFINDGCGYAISDEADLSFPNHFPVSSCALASDTLNRFRAAVPHHGILCYFSHFSWKCFHSALATSCSAYRIRYDCVCVNRLWTKVNLFSRTSIMRSTTSSRMTTNLYRWF